MKSLKSARHQRNYTLAASLAEPYIPTESMQTSGVN